MGPRLFRPMHVLTRVRARLAEQSGFTLIEVMVAILLLTVGVIGSVQLFDGANSATYRTKAREGGTNVAREVVEAARGVPYGKVLDGSVVGELQSQPNLGDASSGGGWELRRRGITYTVDVSVCIADDDKDGLGPHDTAAFCGAAGGTADLNPDDYKRVTVEVRWDEPTARGRVQQTAVISNPGTAAGPAITAFTRRDSSSAPITTNVGSVEFDVTTSDPAATVAWSVDGNHQDNAGGSGTAWSFSWPISSLYDGTYLVSAQAFDQFDAPGAARVLTVELNRNAPLAPPGFIGGWNGTAVEFEWLPNAEGDIEGYRVYRQDSVLGDVLVCSLSKDTTCRDSSPPNLPSMDYYVVAVDRDPGGNLREGAKSTQTVTQGNQPPNPPTGLAAATNQYGEVVLNWVAPVPPDPDVGDDVDFYRIYRDGSAVADRYDRTGPGELSFIDRNAGGGTHTYWVSAVDKNYAESTLVGPVSP